MTTSVVPANRAAFESEISRYCREVLQPNPASDYLIEFIRPAIPDTSTSSDYPPQRPARF